MTSQPGVDILARDVSLFAGSTHNAPIDMLPLAAVLQRIQGGTYRTAVMSLRRLLARGDHTRYRGSRKPRVSPLRPVARCARAPGSVRGPRNSSARPALCILTWTISRIPTP